MLNFNNNGGSGMKGYVQLKNIYTEFRTTTPTINRKLCDLGIKKEVKDKTIYIKESDYSRLKQSLEKSNRIKKLIDIGKEKQEEENKKEALHKIQLEHLQQEISRLKEDIEFKKKEIESFHGILRIKEDAIDTLNNQILLLQETNLKELEEKNKEIFDIKSQLQETNEEKESISKEFKAYKNRSFRQKLIDLLKNNYM